MLREWELALKALGQTTRLKIIFLLATREHCVCELEQIIGLSQSAISQHMRLLKSAGIVNERRDGTWTYYTLRPETWMRLANELSSALSAPRESVPEMAAEWSRQQAILGSGEPNCQTAKKRGCADNYGKD